jgi:hypothetical protein
MAFKQNGRSVFVLLLLNLAFVLGSKVILTYAAVFLFQLYF